MKRGARDSQVVNNFFTFATIIIVSIVLMLYNTYLVKDEPKQIDKLQCEFESKTKVTISNLDILNKSFNALTKGYYKLDGGMIESNLENETLKKAISLEELNQFFIDEIKIEPKKGIEKYLKIKYEIVELDKKDEKNIDSAMLMTSFRINSNEIFRVNTNIKFLYKNAIKERVECTMKVYKNYVEYSRKQMDTN